MRSFRTLLVPQCDTCATPVTDAAGTELTVTDTLLEPELRTRLTADGWAVTPGNARARRGPFDTIGGDTLRCPTCLAREEAAYQAAERRLAAALNVRRVKTLDVSARLGDGWSLTQRPGDAERHTWLVEHDGDVHGRVRRYQRVDGTYSTGWEAHQLGRGTWWRVEAIDSCLHNPKSSFLWSGRDLAAWGIATGPSHRAPRPAWATRRKSTPT